MSMNDEDKTMFAMRISRKEKNELRKLYGDMGLDLSTAVNLFLNKVWWKTAYHFSLVALKELVVRQSVISEQLTGFKQVYK